MLTNLLSVITGIIIHIISSLGYGGIILLMTMHSMAIPVPSEVVMPFAGYLVNAGRFNYLGAVLAGTFGNLVGGSLIYWLCREKGTAFVERWGGMFLFLKMTLLWREKFFSRFGSMAIFFGRCIPIVATFISIPAGLAKVKYWKFAVFTFLGAIIWNFVLVFIGMKLGENWTVLREKLHGFELVIILLIVVGGAWWIWRHLKNRNSQLV